MLDVEITFNKKLLNKILLKLTNLETKMATLEENTILVQQIAEAIANNTSLIDSVRTTTEKIFVEVEALVAAANVEIPGLAELKQAVLAQTEVLVANAAKSVEIDNLIPDAPAEVPEVPEVPAE